MIHIRLLLVKNSLFWASFMPITRGANFVNKKVKSF